MSVLDVRSISEMLRRLLAVLLVLFPTIVYSGQLQEGGWISITVDDLFGADSWLRIDKEKELLLPLIGPVSVNGLSREALQDTLKDRYAKYIENPEVVVAYISVQEAEEMISDGKVPVLIQGWVYFSGYYWMPVGTSLYDAYQMGGPQTFRAAGQRIRFIRDSEEEPVIEGLSPVDLTPDSEILIEGQGVITVHMPRC